MINLILIGCSDVSIKPSFAFKREDTEDKISKSSNSLDINSVIKMLENLINFHSKSLKELIQQKRIFQENSSEIPN